MSFASASRSVLIAVTTKICSPQMIGVALPLPIIGVFHLILVSAFHEMGGSARTTLPLASGPRQWCRACLLPNVRDAERPTVRSHAERGNERVEGVFRWNRRRILLR